MKRNGIGLMELTVAGAVLAVMMAVSMQLLGVIACERKAASRRQTAVREAGNLMQRVSALPWEKLDRQALDELSLSETAAAELPHAELEATIEDESSPSVETKSKRIGISIRWRDSHGQPVAPVRLTAWRYQ